MTAPRRMLCEVMLFGSGGSNLCRVGSGHRELEYYRRIAQHYEVLIFEYDAPESQWLSAGLRSVPQRFRARLLHSTIGAWLAGRESPHPAIIRTKQFWGAWAGILLSRASGRPLIIRMGYHWSYNFILERRIRNRALAGLIRGFERWLLRFADGIVFGSERLAQAFPKKKVPWIVAPNGIDPRLFFPAMEPAQFDLIYVGRLLPIKGFDRLVPLLPRDRRIRIIGAGPLEHLLADRPDIQRIERVDNEQLPGFLRSARCFVSMSRTEGSPKALLEAIFCGCYPILSDIGPHRALVEELGYGALLPADVKPVAMEQALTAAHVDRDRLTVFRLNYSMDRLVALEVDFLNRIAAHV